MSKNRNVKMGREKVYVSMGNEPCAKSEEPKKKDRTFHLKVNLLNVVFLVLIILKIYRIITLSWWYIFIPVVVKFMYSVYSFVKFSVCYDKTDEDEYIELP